MLKLVSTRTHFAQFQYQTFSDTPLIKIKTLRNQNQNTSILFFIDILLYPIYFLLTFFFKIIANDYKLKIDHR